MGQSVLSTWWIFTFTVPVGQVDLARRRVRVGYSSSPGAADHKEAWFQTPAVGAGQGLGQQAMMTQGQWTQKSVSILSLPELGEAVTSGDA